MVGCGKNIPTGLPWNPWGCTRPCGSDPKQLCKECQAKQDALSEQNTEGEKQ